MSRKIPKLLLIIFISLTLIIPLFMPVSAASSGSNQADAEYADLDIYEGKNIGVITGSIYEQRIPELIEGVHMSMFKDFSSLMAALESGKIDAIVDESAQIKYTLSQRDGFKYETIKELQSNIAFVSNKNSDGINLINQLNEYIDSLDKSGELSELKDKWVNGPDEKRTLEDYSSLPDENGTLIIASETTFAPFEYVKDGQLVGYEIEILVGFCKKYGYKPEFQLVDFAGILTGVSTGKFDIGASTFTVTEERKKSVTFSHTSYINNACFMILDESDEGNLISISNIKDSFNKTFIQEDRWKLFVDGINVTLVITLASLILGTLLGLIAHMICRRGNRLTNALSKALSRLIKGLPEVVLLMILFYIIFGNSSIDGIVISIIGFTLCFTCTMHSLLDAGERSLDPGQYRAATALGYNDTKAFFRIILPQSARIFMPDYLASVTTLFKATAIVGYIAVIDITKVADIVRGRTYEAFFPLIAIAIMYFILAALLRLVIRILTRKLNYEKRSHEQILKGAQLK